MAIEFGALFTFLALGVWLFALFDVITAPTEEIRGIQKPLWVVVVLIGFVIGAVAWFVLGRPRPGGAPAGGGGLTGGRRPGGVGARPRPNPIAPDDDPDFLRSLRARRPDEDGPPAGA